MSIASQQRAILKSVDAYDRFLRSISSEEEFLRCPAEGVWSYAEVYSHIFQANLYSLKAVSTCVADKAEHRTKKIHWLAGLILFAGRFPPGKLKVPARLEAMVKKISRQEAAELISAFRSRLAEITPQIGRASSSQKAKHPRLGFLNARQWLRFVQIHTSHHQRQLIRIQKMLSQPAQ